METNGALEKDLSLHTQELDKLATMSLDNHKEPDKSVSIPNERPLSLDSVEDTEVDNDDILPGESFSANPSPEGSLVDGHVYTKPPISIFQNPSVPPQANQPTPPISPSQKHEKKKNNDDIPVRCSDVEDSPPLHAAGFTVDEIPNIYNLNSEDEWGPVPEMTGLPPQFTAQTDKEGNLCFTEEKKKRKRRAKKSKGVKGPKALELADPKSQVTGFEEFYAEPPLRPHEAAEEEQLYDPRLSVALRAERAVQKYRAARRFNPDRERIFSSYLYFGGIRTGPKQFQGLDPHMNGTAEEFAAASATEAVDEKDTKDADVDFVWVIRGFLTYHFPINHGWKNEQDIILACDLLTNFLRYIEGHKVFPEYTENIIAAKALVLQAKEELVKNRRCSNLLPGRFNKACSTYFGGHYQGLYSGSSDEEFETRFTNRKAMTYLRRSRGQAFLAEREVENSAFPCEVLQVKSESMVVKQWIPEGGEDDYIDPQFKDIEIEIFLDPEIMEVVGMHIEATWHRLTHGSWYMDEVTSVLPTFALEVADEDIPDEDPVIT